MEYSDVAIEIIKKLAVKDHLGYYGIEFDNINIDGGVAIVSWTHGNHYQEITVVSMWEVIGYIALKSGGLDD